MPNERSMKKLVLWLIVIIFISFTLSVILYIGSGDNWFKPTSGSIIAHSIAGYAPPAPDRLAPPPQANTLTGLP